MGLAQAFDETVDFLGDRVEVEARPVRRRDAEPRHQRLAAVVPGADRDPVHVEHLCDVVRVHALDVERHDPSPPLGSRPVTDEAGDVREPFERVDQELALVALDRIEPDVGDVVDRRAESHRFSDRLRAGLELVGQLAPGRLLERDRTDHVAAEVEGRHRLEQLRAAPEGADTGGAAELVRGEGEEVAVELLHVDRVVRRSLSGVDHHDRSLLVSPGRQPLDGVDRAQRIRDEVGRDHLHIPALRELVQRVEL